MTTHNLPDGRTLCFVPVPDDGADMSVTTPYKDEGSRLHFHLYHTPIEVGGYTKWTRRCNNVRLPPGFWVFIATKDAISEEQAEQFVRFCEMAHYGIDGHTGGYMCYVAGHWQHATALDSFRSLLQSLNLTGRHAVLVKNPE